jgi:hypothetical protein
MSAIAYWMYFIFLIRSVNKKDLQKDLINIKQLCSPAMKVIYGERHRIHLHSGKNLDLELDLLRNIEIHG